MRAKACDLLSLTAILLLCAIFAAIALNGLFVTCVVETAFSADNNEHVVFLRDHVTFNLAALAVGLICVWLVLKCRITRRTNVVAAIGMLFCVTAAGVCWVSAAQALPYADAKFILSDAARAAADAGALSGSVYLKKYPFQTGFLLYAECMTRLFGNSSAVVMQYCNILFVNLAYLALLGVARRLFQDERIVFLTILLLLLCLQPIFLCTFVYGTLPGLAFALWGVYAVIRYIKGRGLMWMLAAALLTAAAVVLKKNYAVVAVACGIALLLDALRNRAARPLLLCTLLALCAVLAPALVQKSYEARAQTSFGRGLPQSAWLAMGLGESSMCSGWHNAQLAVDFAESGFDYAQSDAAFRLQACERARLLFSRPRYLGSFFYHKLTSQWNTPSFQSVWSSAAGGHAGALPPLVESLYSGDGARAIERYFDCYTQLVYCGFTCALILLCRRKLRTEAMLILPLAVLGAFLYHAVFEAKAQYALPYLPMLLPYCVYAFVALRDRLQRRAG